MEALEHLFNCMSFIAGKGVTRSRRVIVGHNEDDGGLNFVRHAYVPARDWPEGSVLPAEPGLAAVPQVPHTFGYYWTELKTDEHGLYTSDSFTNENGVVVTSNSMSISAESQEDPAVVRDGGIGYNLRRAIAERAKSARDGARVLMELIGTWGYAFSGRAYTIADKDEAFMFQLVRGRHYIGARVPDNAVIVMPNHYTFHTLTDVPEMFYPDDIVTYAIEKGWYTPAAAGDFSDFDFAAAYQHKDSRFHSDNVPRQKHGSRIVLQREWDIEKDGFPFAVYPDRELDIADFAGLLSSHYEGTEDDRTGVGPGHTPHNDPACRRICAYDTLESMIWQFDEEPALTTVFTALGHPCQLSYLPLHPLIALPESLIEEIDPCEMIDTHLGADASISAYRGTAAQRFRDFCCRSDLVYSDELPALKKVTAELLESALAENEATLALLRGCGADEAKRIAAERDSAYLEMCLEKLNAIASVSPVSITAAASPKTEPRPETVTLTLESEQELIESELVFGVDLTGIFSSYAHAVPGSLQKAEDGTYRAEFPLKPFGRHLRPNPQNFWLGGKTADGKAFAANIIL